LQKVSVNCLQFQKDFHHFCQYIQPENEAVLEFYCTDIGFLSYKSTGRSICVKLRGVNNTCTLRMIQRNLLKFIGKLSF
jgi:hypothetical protein